MQTAKPSVGGSTVGTTETGGAVRYSRPIGVAADPAMGAGGLTLELQYANGASAVTAFTGGKEQNSAAWKVTNPNVATGGFGEYSVAFM